MVSATGRYVLAFNGEIYNHEALRKQHLPLQVWKGRSDTETLLALIEKIGVEKVPAELTGMFAFIVWDQKKRCLHLVRDRFGEKPLYYGQQDGYFFFTSDLKALLHCHKFKASIDKEALALYFRFLYVPSPFSIFEGICKCPVASIVTIDTASMTLSTDQYWTIEEFESLEIDQNLSFSESVNQIETLLLESVSHQMLADVPVGAFLSGGIDSSTIVSLMSEISRERVNTYCIGFSSDSYNEAPFAKKIADHLGTNHTEYYIEDHELIPLVQSMSFSFDEPFADSSQIATYAVAERARQDATVCLTGDGGDELFGGYTRYVRARKMQRLRSITGNVGRTLASKIVNSTYTKSTLNGINYFAADDYPMSNQFNQFARMLQLLTKKAALDCYQDMTSYWRYPFSPSLTAEPDLQAPMSFDSEIYKAAHPKYFQKIDMNSYLLDDILCKVDRACMGVSLESRVPLLDHKLANYVWSLPVQSMAQDKTKQTVNKPLLFELASKRIPRELLKRPKQGFGVPLHNWLAGPLKPWTTELLSRDNFQKHGLLNQDVVDNLLKQHHKGNQTVAPLVWSVVMFQAWYMSVYTA